MGAHASGTPYLVPATNIHLLFETPITQLHVAVHMCICMYVWTFVYVCTYVYVCMYVRIFSTKTDEKQTVSDMSSIKPNKQSHYVQQGPSSDANQLLAG